ncbi:LysR family transcriptional regulator [Nesterenkonia sp. Act20]|uniref:LysR family transcriptional regulator n=1 Tax=Nesterenkonia sp. Act20 TaxID=1483432 RepID=UPI001C4448E8
MELRQLEYFLAVAEEGTFTRGARRVHVAQSAVSATIRKLERELGMPLFLRESHRSSLTEAGAALLPEALALVSAARHAHETVSQVRGGLRGTIRIGTLIAIANRGDAPDSPVVDLPAVLGRFHVTHPLVRYHLQVSPRGTAGHLADIAGGLLDLALVATTDQPPGVRTQQIGAVRWSFVCRRRHRLADAGSVRLEELSGETFVDFPLGWGNRSMVDRAFAELGLAREVPFEAADQATALGLIRHGLGVAFLPRAGSEHEDLAVLEVEGPPLLLPISLATPRQRPPTAATAALIQSIVRAARPSPTAVDGFA